MTNTTVPAAAVTLTGSELERITELLEITDMLLRRMQPQPIHQADQLLRERGITGGLHWLIDMVGFTALHLRTAVTGDASDE